MNGNFDQGSENGWTEIVNGAKGKLIYPCSSSGILQEVRDGCNGSHLAWLGGVSKATVDVLKQSITLPVGYDSIGVKFRYFIDAARQTNCDVDSSQVDFAGTRRTFDLCSSNPDKGWQEATIPGSGASGVITVTFTTTLTSGKVSSFFVDDVQLCSDNPNRVPADTPPCTSQAQSSSIPPPNPPSTVSGKEPDGQ